MENITKALLMAAGMLLAVLILSLLVMAYNKLSGYYEQSQELLTAEQLDKFNKQFQNYAGRKDIRGNELISLMNKIIDYNESESYQVGTNYEPIKVKITIGENLVDAFKYETDDSQKVGAQNEYITAVIQNTINSTNNQANDKNLIAITNTPEKAREIANGVGITNLTDTQLQKLTMEISNILIDETSIDNSSNEYRRLRAISLRNILKLDIGTNATNYIVLKEGTYITDNTNDSKEKMEAIKQIVSIYYQYTQFKRAYFSCPESGITYNSQTGRVVGMEFKVQTKEEQNGQIVVQFD